MNDPTILIPIRVRAIRISGRTNPVGPNHILKILRVRIAVVRTMLQKTVGLAWRTKGSLNPVESRRTKRS